MNLKPHYSGCLTQIKALLQEKIAELLQMKNGIMTRMASSWVIGLAFAIGNVGVIAADGAAAAPKPYAGWINEWLREQSQSWNAWDIGVQNRVRQEFKLGAGVAPATDFRRYNVDNRNIYFLYRVRPHVGYSANGIGFYLEGRHSGSIDDDRGPRNPEADPMDIHQAYITLGNTKDLPLSLKLGRQELSYGEERLVGAFAWNNIGRVFDAAKITLRQENFSVDAFTSMLTVVDQHNLNYPNPDDWFSGVYVTTKFVPKNTLDLYFLSRNAGRQSYTAANSLVPLPSPRDIYTAGIRLKSLPGQFGNWDYSIEVMGQWGHFNDPLLPAGARSLRHEAYALVCQGGYTFKEAAFTPRIGLEYSAATGDGNPNDGKHGTFENLFPTNHKFYGYMDMVSLQNIHNLRATISMNPVKRFKFSLDWHAFWLADSSDHFYNAAGARRAATLAPTPGTGYGINPNYSSYVGSELDLVATYTLHPAAVVEAGYGHFFRGSYIRQTFSAAGHGSRDADYVYLQFALNF